MEMVFVQPDKEGCYFVSMHRGQSWIAKMDGRGHIYAAICPGQKRLEVGLDRSWFFKGDYRYAVANKDQVKHLEACVNAKKYIPWAAKKTISSNLLTDDFPIY